MIEPLLVWWNAREAREKLLIAVAGLLTLTLAVWQFVLVPSSAFRDTQRRAFGQALSEHAFVVAASRATGNANEPATRDQPLQSVLSTTSDLYGLTMSRILPADENGLNVWFDSAEPALLYAWIGELERQHGVRVQRAVMRRNPEGTQVNANFFFTRVE